MDHTTYSAVKWIVEIGDEFEPEYDALPDKVQDELLAMTRLLQKHADTMKGSSHANMKELRFKAADGVWRVAFAFDPRRRAVLLVAGDKSGTSEKRFYREFIAKADDRYDAHLSRLAKKRRK